MYKIGRAGAAVDSGNDGGRRPRRGHVLPCRSPAGHGAKRCHGTTRARRKVQEHSRRREVGFAVGRVSATMVLRIFVIFVMYNEGETGGASEVEMVCRWWCCQSTCSFLRWLRGRLSHTSAHRANVAISAQIDALRLRSRTSSALCIRCPVAQILAPTSAHSQPLRCPVAQFSYAE